MVKTIEEMRSSVLAYCEEVCPKGTKEAIVANGVTLEWIDYVDVMTGGLRLYGVADWMYIESDMDEYVTLHAYRLLGLAERDAVAAEKARFFKEIDSCTLSLGKMAIRAKVAEARNAALVEALEKIKQEHGLEHGFLRGKRPVINLLGEFINEVLEANTEKGGGDE